jgi:hypothetical protein
MQVKVYCYIFVFFFLVPLLILILFPLLLLHCNPTWVLVFYSRPFQAFIFDDLASFSQF